MWRGVFGLLLLLVGCGRLGDPLPPFIRIPVPVRDLAVSQRGYDITLTWTNPAQNIDGSASTDLERIQILSDGRSVTSVATSGAGMVQSYTFSAQPLVGMPRTFTVRAETANRKGSELSNVVSIVPVDVPGRVVGLRHLVDQNRILLEWDPPLENAGLADLYLIIKTVEDSEVAESVSVTERKYEDVRYEQGRNYVYTVTALRQGDSIQIPGIDGPSQEVVATDSTPPRSPAGLEFVTNDDGAFLTWTENTEGDLAGYRIFRSLNPETGYVPLTKELNTSTGIFDAAYQSGIYYVVSAVDESGNESPGSAPLRAP